MSEPGPADFTASAQRHGVGPSGRGVPPLRRTAGRFVAAASLGVAFLASLMWVDVLAGNVVPVLQALTPVWIIAAFGCLALTLVVRTRASFVALVPLVVSTLAAGVALSSHPDVPREVATRAGDHHLRVLSLNSELGEAETASVMEAVRETNPDVVVFVEMTTARLRSLDDAGLAQRFPHRSRGMIDDGSRGTVILSRFPTETLDADTELGPWDLQSPVVRVHAPGAQIVVKGVHTYPPLRDGVAQWRPQLRAEGEWQRERTAEHVVMAGDFNASRAHPAFRQLSRGMVDAYPHVHGAWRPTWPMGGSIPAFSQIDHILTRGFVPEQAGIVTVEGTDHAGVWSDLRY